MSNGNGKVAFVNPGQLGRIFALNWRAGIPTCVVGDNGTGKTTAAEEFVASLNAQNTGKKGKRPWRLWKLILGVMDPADLGGYPVPDKAAGTYDADGPPPKVNYVMPAHMDFFDSDVRGVVLADEFDRAKPDVQNAWLQFLLGRNIHGHSLSPNAYLIMTMNGAADIFTTPLSKAARTRMCFIYVSHGAQKGAESWDNWAEENDVNAVVRGFAKFRPDLMKCHEQYEELAALTPRTEVMAGQVLDALRQVTFETSDILLPILAGIIGKAPAVELLGYHELYTKCPDPDVIIEDPDNAEVPSEKSVLYALGSALVSRCAKDDRETAEKVCRYASRLPTEMAAFVYHRVDRRCPSVVTTQTFLKWAEAHELILI